MKKLSFRMLALAIVAMLSLSACTQNTTTPPPATQAPATQAPATNAPATQAPATETPTEAPKEPVILRITQTQATTTYNPFQVTNGFEYTQALWVNAALYNRIYSEDKQTWVWAPELADGNPVCLNKEPENKEGIDPKADPLKKYWSIKILPGYTFEDGTPIDASVFEYSWKMLLDPKLANRNYSALAVVDGAEAYYTGEDPDWSHVGLKAVGEYEIELAFENMYIPTSDQDAMSLFSFVGCSVVHPATFEKCFNADKTENTYGTSVDRFVSSGAYTITKFIDGQYVEYTKRIGGSPYAENLWNPDVVQSTVVTDQNTAMQMYEKGEIDIVSADSKEYNDYPDLYRNFTPDTYGVFINALSTKNPVLQNKDFRLAMYWGIDRVNLLKQTQPTQRALARLYGDIVKIEDPKDASNWLQMNATPESKAIRLDGHELTADGYDPTLAKEYFDKAYAANGNKKIVVQMLYSEGSDMRKAWAEALQYSLQELFGADRFQMDLQATPHATVYEKMARTSLDFDMSCTAGIYQDIQAPWGNTNWVSSGPYTYSTQYTIVLPGTAEEWDRMFYENEEQNRYDSQKRLENSAKMEELILNDVTFIPTHGRGTRAMIAEHIEILMHDGVGDPYLDYALLQARYN